MRLWSRTTGLEPQYEVGTQARTREAWKRPGHVSSWAGREPQRSWPNGVISHMRPQRPREGNKLAQGHTAHSFFPKVRHTDKGPRGGQGKGLPLIITANHRARQLTFILVSNSRSDPTESPILQARKPTQGGSATCPRSRGR